MDVRDQLRQFVQQSFLVDELADDESFLRTGIVDSLGVMQIVAFLESEFAIAVSDRDLVPENFDSVERLAAYIERKRRAA